VITKELAVYLGQRGYGELHHTTLTQGGRKPFPSGRESTGSVRPGSAT
jgi:hypothetical protein